MALMRGMRLVPGLAQKPSDPATHALLINSERLDVSPPCGAALWVQRTSTWHGGLTGRPLAAVWGLPRQLDIRGRAGLPILWGRGGLDRTARRPSA